MVLPQNEKMEMSIRDCVCILTLKLMIKRCGPGGHDIQAVFLTFARKKM
jgi:hypothetical protein